MTCGGGSDGGTGPAPVPTDMAIQSGGSQSGTVGAAVTALPAALVTDAQGRPVGGIAVTFTIKSGGGTVTGGSARTNSQGIATVGSWILGGTAGTQSLTGTTAGIPPVEFVAEAVAGPPAAVTPLLGNHQLAAAGSAVPKALVARVTDQFGNAIADVAVAFAVATGGGSLTGATAVITDVQGLATAGTWTLGTVAGPNTLSATVAGLTPAIFNADARPSAVASMAILAGDSQSAGMNRPTAIQPSVKVADEFGNGVPFVVVSFSVIQGGGSVGTASMQTDQNGRAATSWQMGPAGGLNVMRASALGLPDVDFTATAIQTGLVKIAGDSQVELAGVKLPIDFTFRLLDVNASPMVGHIPHLSEAIGGGREFGRFATDSNGIGRFSWAFGLAGENSVTIQVAGATLTYTGTSLVGPPALLQPVGLMQSARVGTSVPAEIGAMVTDLGGNPQAGIDVTFTVAPTNGNVIGPVATSDGLGKALVGSWILGSLVKTDSMMASVPGFQSILLTANALPGDAATIERVAGDSQTASAGQSLPLPMQVRVLDQFDNAVPGVVVTFGVLSGGGSLLGTTATTDLNGMAQRFGWTLGLVPGINQVQAVVQGTAAATVFTATGLVTPGSIVKQNGDGQTAVVGTALPINPSVVVLDTEGQPLAGIPVHFGINMTGGGGIAALLDTSDAAGVASPGSWTMGTSPGANSMGAGVIGLPGVTFNATAVVGPPATIAVQQGDGQTQRVGSAVSVAPGVLITDQFGNPVPGVSVGFAIASGGGSVTGSPVMTDANGVATVGSWVLGASAGSNTLTATAAPGGIQGNPVTFTATGVAPTYTMALNAGNNQTSVVNSPVAIPPSVLIRDQFNLPVPGIPVDFSVTSGGGSVGVVSALTNANGVATAVSWTLGPVAGTNGLSASTTATPITGNPVTFTATGFVASYNIEVRPLSSLTASQQAAFTAAEIRLEAVLVGELPNIFVNAAAGTCLPNQPVMNETVDDVVIFADVVAIDGPGGILGQAGPCFIRTTGSLPVVGVMQFDVADLTSIEASGLLQAVILHEMQHVLGFGSLWSLRGLLSGAGGLDPFFNGTNAITSFDALGGSNYPGSKVPVENTGGSGTRDSHWRETVFLNELMTGFVNNGANPLSAVTINQFRDMGYQVNTAVADPFGLGPFPSPVRPGAARLQMIDDLWRGPLFEIEPSGVIRAVPRR